MNGLWTPQFGFIPLSTVKNVAKTILKGKGKGKGKGVCKLFMEIHLTTTECNLPYGITQCYLSTDTSEHTPPRSTPARQAGTRFTDHLRMEG